MGQALLSAEGTRDVPLRHHTLHHAIEWRYALLSAAEQAAFLHLGVFVGRWTLEAADAVIPKREPDPPTWRKRRCLVRLTPEHATLRRHHDAGHRTLEFWSPPRRVRSGCRPSCNHAAAEKGGGTPPAQAWFAGGERVGIQRCDQAHQGSRAPYDCGQDVSRDGHGFLAGEGGGGAEQVCAEGRAMTLEQAIEYVRNEAISRSGKQARRGDILPDAAGLSRHS